MEREREGGGESYRELRPLFGLLNCKQIQRASFCSPRRSIIDRRRAGAETSSLWKLAAAAAWPDAPT